MAEGILGLGSSGSAGLSQELIDKLKAAEAKAQVDPYTDKLEKWDKELEKITEIETKITELLGYISDFDLYNTSANAFEQVTASTTGTSAVFNAVDVAGLIPGSNTVTISQLAQRDVYQTSIFADKDVQVAGGDDAGDKISIEIDGTTYDFSTEGKTYQELADEINENEKFTASVEQVGDNDYRLVIKSTDSGTANALTITQTGVDLGITSVLSAQNMKANIDGVDYDVASNTITIQGNLTMTAVELGTSTITIQKDNSNILPTLQKFVTTYNELVDIVDGELYSADSPIDDPGTLRMIMSSIKDKLFGEYGDSGDKSLFNYGFDVDKTGHISLDTEIFGNALASNLDDIKALFVGTAENPGLGTQLKEYLDNLDSYDGLLTRYGESMADRKKDLEDEKEKAQEALDTKYALMLAQFAEYTAIITQMETAFGGMKMMIEQSTASN